MSAAIIASRWQIIKPAATLSWRRRHEVQQTRFMVSPHFTAISAECEQRKAEQIACEKSEGDRARELATMAEDRVNRVKKKTPAFWAGENSGTSRYSRYKQTLSHSHFD